MDKDIKMWVVEVAYIIGLMYKNVVKLFQLFSNNAKVIIMLLCLSYSLFVNSSN